MAMPARAAIDTRRSVQVALTAVRALHDELCLYPKPGLVSMVDNGSHDDMTPALFVRSLFSLRRYFAEAYRAGRDGATFDVLATLGRAAERRMLHSTNGVNTHRGAIFNLGILCAAVGSRDAMSGLPGIPQLIVANWSAGIKLADSHSDGASNGGRACRQYAVGGARGEAAAGFPHVFNIALPALRAVRRAGGDDNAMRCQAFFAILASLEDTNLLHRGGIAGLDHARQAAHGFLHAGGVLAADWRQHALRIHHGFVARRLSPGGAADLLAATLFMDRIDMTGHH